MSTLATVAAGGFLALLTAAAITIAMRRAADRLGHLLPAERGDDEPGPGIRVNPGRPEGDL